MKNINKILTLALGAGVMLTSQSCKESYLDVDHYDILSADYISASDENMEDGLLACYANMNQMLSEDSMKPWLWFSGHPTMDTQATGWDKSWLTQSWAADQKEVYDEWKKIYDGISLCNNLLVLIHEDGENLSEDAKKAAEAEAKAMRGFYFFLATEIWKNVPILKEGQSTTELVSNANNALEALQVVIDDLTYAYQNLDWKPRNDQYGRATKGMAAAYLAEAYLWRAFRNGNASGNDADVQQAKTILKDIIDNGPYELMESFTTLWDAKAWNKETIWEEVMDEGDQSKEWGNFHTNAHGWTDNYAANPAGNGGWGTLYLSWEWWTCFEKGDKRREASACTDFIDDWGDYKNRITDEPLSTSAKSDYCYGQNPYMDEIKGSLHQYHANTGGDRAPAIWSLKWWRTGKNTWWSNIWNPVNVYWKRYADVLLTYAECCFRTDGPDSQEGWNYVNEIRKRAFGELETGNEAALTTKYGQYYFDYATADGNQIYGGTYDVSHFTDDNGNIKYPIPFGVWEQRPDAKTYYDQVKSKLGFTLETWQVAMIQERRKEFNCEWVLAQALRRSGLLAEHIAKNYPKDATPISALDKYPWAPRSFDYSDEKMDFPIPAQEIVRNPNLVQNPTY